MLVCVHHKDEQWEPKEYELHSPQMNGSLQVYKSMGPKYVEPPNSVWTTYVQLVCCRLQSSGSEISYQPWHLQLQLLTGYRTFVWAAYSVWWPPSSPAHLPDLRLGLNAVDIFFFSICLRKASLRQDFREKMFYVLQRQLEFFELVRLCNSFNGVHNYDIN